MPLYDFVCEREHVTERLAPFGCERTECFVCGKPATRVAVNRILVNMPGPKGELVKHYYEAASEAKDAYERTDDPVAKAATRPDIWRPAYTRARNKLQAAQIMGNEPDRWADPDPHKSAREVLAAEI